MRNKMKRRDFLKKSAGLTLGLSSFSLFTSPAAYTMQTKPNRKPNVVFFLADDLGWGDISLHGGKTPTPNIDKIFMNGLEITNFMVHCVCSPTRAGLLTGRHYTNVRTGPEVGGTLGLEEVTFAEAFKQAGYTTGCFGKWHNGFVPEDPTFNNVKKINWGSGVLSHGFDRFVGFYSGGEDYFNKYDNWSQTINWWHDHKYVPDEEGYNTDLITKHAIEFIEANKDQPFFCYIPHAAVHAPLQAPDKYLKRVPKHIIGEAKLKTSAEYLEIERKDRSKLTKKDIETLYSAMLIGLDDGIGKVIDKLEMLGLMNDTIIFFTSDNGATGNGNNLPFRGTKHTFWEGGTHAPTAAWWKGTEFSGGKRYDGFMGYLDFYPTISAMADVTMPKGKLLDGKNCLANIKNNTKTDIDYYYAMGFDFGTIRSETWKLFYYSDHVELYNVKEDIGETRNLAAKKPAVTNKLKAKYEDWIYSNNFNVTYMTPKVDKPLVANPQVEVLEVKAHQKERIGNSLDIFFTRAPSYDYDQYVEHCDFIEYDICVATDGREDGFLYSPGRGWSPKFRNNTGIDQWSRIQTKGPGVRAGKGIWERRRVGIGNICGLGTPIQFIRLVGPEPGYYHFYLDNITWHRTNGSQQNIFNIGKDLIRHERPIPKHPVFENVQLNIIPLSEVK
jgi:arylsulfatase A-like enzyme